jgi:hypothetical protein
VKGKRTERGQIFDENGPRGYFRGKIIKESKRFKSGTLFAFNRKKHGKRAGFRENGGEEGYGIQTKAFFSPAGG